MVLRRRFLAPAKSDTSTACVQDGALSPFLAPFNSPLSHSGYPTNRRITANVIIASACVACGVLFLILMYYTILIRRQREVIHTPSGTDSEEGPMDYPLWHIRTEGLHESVINSITAKPCVSGAGTTVGCSVCLNDFREGELARLLPCCGHCFHVSCIDTWLRAHISCPLCRSNIFDPVPVLPSGELSVGSVETERDPQTSDQRVSEELQEDGDVTVINTSMDSRSTHRDRVDLLGNVLRQEWRPNSMVTLHSSDLSIRIDEPGISEDGGNLKAGQQSHSGVV